MQAKCIFRSTEDVLAVYISHQPSVLAPLTEHELEDVVEDEVAAGSIRQKLEALAVVHWSLLLVDLEQYELASSSKRRRRNGIMYPVRLKVG